jgi:polar amino acid transport system ATP-binding protein
MCAVPVVSTENIYKRYGSREVLCGVTMHVQRGEVICLIGPSGSGKTTFLRCINHLEKVDSGQVRINDQLIGYRMGKDGRLREDTDLGISKARAQIGFVFQRFNLWPHMTALENIIEAPIHVLGLHKEDAVAEAERLLARVHLSEKRDSYPGKLSGGQQQRVAIARALAMKPSVMLFDEPTSALDPEMIGEVLEVMRELANEGMTMIIVTHEMGFAREVAHSIVMIDHGRIVEQAPPLEFFLNARSERTREFLARIL